MIILFGHLPSPGPPVDPQRTQRHGRCAGRKGAGPRVAVNPVVDHGHNMGKDLEIMGRTRLVQLGWFF